MRKSNISNTSSNTSGKTSAIKVGPKDPMRSRTDWACVDALADEDINTFDIPPLTEADFARSKWRFPAPTNPGVTGSRQQVTVEVAIDEDTLTWFQSLGQDYPQRMRAALRLYAEAHQAAA